MRINGSAFPALFCVPICIKDNIDVVGTATTAGSMSLTDNFPEVDAAAVRGLRRRGAVILAKANMGEFAWSPFESRGSLFGVIRNPYDTSRTVAGSSGGSAAAVAAGFAQAALGTDTGDSTRGPASHCACVGLRPTIGRTSRNGTIPARLNRDTIGIISRTVEDAARVLGAIAGHDPQTKLVETQAQPDDWTYVLDKHGLQGARIGILRTFADASTPQVAALFGAAIKDLKALGASVVDINVTGNSMGADWDGSAGAANSSALAKGVWSVGRGAWEVLWSCQL
jgi:Asp-tRNA(Asn)/Glu-tRNA(Gln) amidotransferase A subunit family amidase